MNADIDISNVTLKTERLILRPWRPDDLADFNEYASVDGVGQMAGWLPHKNLEESRKILDTFIAGKNEFALEYNGKVIGSLGIEKYNEEVLPEYDEKTGREIGYVLSKDYWGMGLMPEAVSRVIEYLFEGIKLDFIVCGHYAENDQSRRVQEKCGFRHLKLIKTQTRHVGAKDLWVSVLERENYKGLRGATAL